MTIISGTAEFTTPRPFESRSARVALNFTVPDGGDVGGVINAVSHMARTAAERMIQDAPLEQYGKPAYQQIQDKLDEVQVAVPPVPPVAAKRTRAAAAPPPAPAAVAEPASAVEAAPVPPTPLPPPVPPGSTQTPTSDPLAAPAAPQPVGGLPVHLTDAAINNAITAKLSGHEAGTPERQAMTVAIKNLRAEYTGGLEVPWAAVQDADKRTAFLSRLGVL